MRTYHLLLSAVLAGCGTQQPDLFLSRPGNGTTGSHEEGLRYYAKIGADTTLRDWLSRRCFFDSNNGLTQAFYYNGADLGLGRELYCWQCPMGAPNAGLISCSVSNHGVPQGLDLFNFTLNDGTQHVGVDRKQSIKGALAALNAYRDAVDKGIKDGDSNLPLRGASVVFDFDAKREDKVRMYIYDASQFTLFSAVNPLFGQAQAAFTAGNQADRTGAEQLITGLQLDGEGGGLNARVKFIRNCLACHGGRYDEQKDLIIGATFLDFDAVLFNYSNDPDSDIRVSLDRNLRTSCQKNLPQLAQMSQYVLTAATAVGARMIVDRVTQNLANNFFIKEQPDGTCIPDPARSYVPAGWNMGRNVARFQRADGVVENISDAQFFKVAVHKYCASCHFSQTPVTVAQSATQRIRVKDPSQPLTFETADQWFKNENLADLDTLRKTRPQATSLDLIRQVVCGSSDMPHAEVTRNNMKRDSLAFAYICNAEAVPF